MALDTVNGGRRQLTVVVPVWDDYVRFLPDAVRSIEHQRCDLAIQLLIVDNASGVRLPAVPNAHIVHLTGRVSLGAARNAGLASVGTEFVAFVDADDVVPPGYLRFGVDRLAARPDAVMVGTRPVALDDATGRESPFPWPTDRAIAASLIDRRLLAIRNLLVQSSIVMSGSVFRTQAVRRAGGYSDLSYGEDANLAMLLPFLGDVELHRHPNRRYRIHAGSIARRLPERAVVEAAYRDARERLRQHPDVPRWAKSLLPLAWLHHRRRIAASLSGADQRAIRASAAVEPAGAPLRPPPSRRACDPSLRRARAVG